MAVKIRDVAHHAGVSVGTVSNVLNRPQEVATDTIERVRRAIDELGYVRNDAARTLRAGVSATLGFVVLDGQNPFYTDVVRGAEDEATRHGLAVLYGNTAEDPDRERMYLDLFREQQVRGVLIAPYGDVAQRLRALRGAGIVPVLVDRFSGDARFSSVSVDGIEGGRLAASHLIDSGRRRLAFVGGPFDIRQVTDRLAGARAAAENASRDVSLEIVATPAMTVEAGVRAGAAILARPRQDWPDAVFAANDLLALGLLQAIVTDGRATVPGDIAIVGFDDIPFAAAAAVPLSSIRQPSRMIGRTAVRILLEEAGDPDAVPRQTVFPPELVVRASSGRV